VRASAGRADALELVAAVDGPALVAAAALSAGERLMERLLTN
jgi:hypothetical protein